jgi:hypothetical protein
MLATSTAACGKSSGRNRGDGDELDMSALRVGEPTGARGQSAGTSVLHRGCAVNTDEPDARKES